MAAISKWELPRFLPSFVISWFLFTCSESCLSSSGSSEKFFSKIFYICCSLILWIFFLIFSIWCWYVDVLSVPSLRLCVLFFLLIVWVLTSFHLILFLKTVDMLSQCLILSITKKVISCLLVLGQQTLVAIQIQSFH